MPFGESQAALMDILGKINDCQEITEWFKQTPRCRPIEPHFLAGNIGNFIEHLNADRATTNDQCLRAVSLEFVG